METSLLKLLQSHTFWQDNRHKLVETMFSGDVAALYRTITEAHEVYGRDLTLEEIRQLHRVNHPTMTTAARGMLEELYSEIEDAEPVGEDVAQKVLSFMWKQETFREIADIALKGLDGKTPDLTSIMSIIERRAADFLPTEEVQVVPDDLETVLELLDTSVKWTLNVQALAERIPGASPGEFWWYLARPEVGKTAFYVSLAMAPYGWCWQGAKVHVIVNEEPGIRTKMRAINAATEMTRREIKEDMQLAKARWAKVKENFVVADAVNMTMAALDSYCRRHKPDILIIDQLDKMTVSGQFDGDHQRLRLVYILAREIAKRHNCLVLGVCQCSVEGEGKTRIVASMAEGSKTGKFAEADVIIGIGKAPLPEGSEEEDFTRWLTVSKNKVSGWHGTATAMLNPFLSTYF